MKKYIYKYNTIFTITTFLQVAKANRGRKGLYRGEIIN